MDHKKETLDSFQEFTWLNLSRCYLLGWREGMLTDVKNTQGRIENYIEKYTTNVVFTEVLNYMNTNEYIKHFSMIRFSIKYKFHKTLYSQIIIISPNFSLILNYILKRISFQSRNSRLTTCTILHQVAKWPTSF